MQMGKMGLAGAGVLMAAATLLSGCGSEEQQERPLSVENGKIVDYRGGEVILRGVERGGGLVLEKGGWRFYSTGGAGVVW